MNKADIRDFFDELSVHWDRDMIRHEDVIAEILDHGGINAGVHVLDVACGTGVLFPDYVKREVGSVMGVDFSPKMAAIAAEKAAQWDRVSVICGDIEEISLPLYYDCIMVYNAFPHFPDPGHLVRVLADKLVPGGILSIAHGMSRARIGIHHEGQEGKYAMGLISEDQLAQLMEAAGLRVTCKISDERMYQVCGRK